MNYATMIGVADETEAARAGSVIRDSRPIPKCHPDRPFGSKGLCEPCYRAELFERDYGVAPPMPASEPPPLTPAPEAPITADLRLLADRLTPRPRSRAGRWLTPTEERVVEGLLEACSNKEIAGRLGISHQTVKNHMSSIFRNTGARSRSEVVVMWQRRRAGIDVDGALAYLGEVQRGLALVQRDVDRLLRGVRAAQTLLTSGPLASEVEA